MLAGQGVVTVPAHACLRSGFLRRGLGPGRASRRRKPREWGTSGRGHARPPKQNKWAAPTRARARWRAPRVKRASLAPETALQPEAPVRGPVAAQRTAPKRRTATPENSAPFSLNPISILGPATDSVAAGVTGIDIHSSLKIYFTFVLALPFRTLFVPRGRSDERTRVWRSAS